MDRRGDGLLVHRHFDGAKRGPADRRGHAGGAVEPADDRLLRLRRRQAIGAAARWAGPLLAASRTMLVWQADEDRMTEAFGLFALAGKVTSFAAPFLIDHLNPLESHKLAVATEASGSQRVGVTPILFLFLVGLVGMAWVDAHEGRAGRPAGPGIPAGPARIRRMRERGRHVFRVAGNGGRRPLGQREGVIPGGSPGRRMQAHGGTSSGAWVDRPALPACLPRGGRRHSRRESGTAHAGARGYIVGSTAGRHRRRPEAAEPPRQAPPPAGIAGSPLRMDGGTPGSFGLSANRRNLGGLREFADSRWGRHW